MRVLTHNMLMCNVKGCISNNFPLIIRATQVENVPSNFNREFVLNVIPKLDWPALVKGAKDVRILFLLQPIPERQATDNGIEGRDADISSFKPSTSSLSIPAAVTVFRYLTTITNRIVPCVHLCALLSKLSWTSQSLNLCPLTRRRTTRSCNSFGLSFKTFM